MGGVAMGWYMLLLNAVPVPGGIWVSSVLGYLLQTSVLWLLCLHFVQNTFLSQHHCCLCPCFPHWKHIRDSILLQYCWCALVSDYGNLSPLLSGLAGYCLSSCMFAHLLPNLGSLSLLCNVMLILCLLRCSSGCYVLLFVGFCS